MPASSHPCAIASCKFSWDACQPEAVRPGTLAERAATTHYFV